MGGWRDKTCTLGFNEPVMRVPEISHECNHINILLDTSIDQDEFLCPLCSRITFTFKALLFCKFIFLVSASSPAILFYLFSSIR